MPEGGRATIFAAKLSIIFHPAKFSAKKICKAFERVWASKSSEREQKGCAAGLLGYAESDAKASKPETKRRAVEAYVGGFWGY
ncbi:MAG: hypothetical protein ACI4AM_10060 [Muribaculaceae bacterium]